MEKLIRVFPRRTKWTPDDDLAFYGEPTPLALFRPKADWPVRISVCFTKDIDRANRLVHSWKRFYTDVKIGGPALDDRGDLFVPGRYIKNGVTITSRGCPRRCPWCFAWGREGNEVRELPIRRGHIVQDNNLLATSYEHQSKVLEMLKAENVPIKYSGGLDIRLWRNKHRAFLEDVKLNEAWFACDTPNMIRTLERVRKTIKSISRKKLRCYVLVGFEGETVKAADQRIRAVYNLGFDPFAQFYQGPGEQDKTSDWKDFCFTWCQPGKYRKLMEGAK